MKSITQIFSQFRVLVFRVFAVFAVFALWGTLGDALRHATRPIQFSLDKYCGTVGILTGLLCDVTGDLNSNFTVAFNG